MTKADNLSRQLVQFSINTYNRRQKSQKLLYIGNHFNISASYKPFPEMGLIHTERVEVSDHYSKRDEL